MSTEPQLFRINPESKESEKITEVDFARLGFQERWDIQEWVANNPEILGDDLLIIGKEFSGFDRTNERLDLLAIEPDGTLVIIELKRDDTGSDAHWQAIKYASYFRHAQDGSIISMLAAYKDVSDEDAFNMLLKHLGDDDLNSLNHDQRIILASHRFATEVTSAVLWLNDKVPNDNFIACVQLTPYQDGNSLYVQANTIIPVPGTERYSIQIGSAQDDAPAVTPRRPAREQNRNDEVSQFVRQVEALALEGLPNELKLDANDGWAKGIRGRWYCMWYSSRYPWGRGNFNYVFHISINRDRRRNIVVVNFETRKRYLRDTLKYSESEIANLKVFLEPLFDFDGIQDSKTYLRPRVIYEFGELDDSLAKKVADTLREMIQTITPAVEEFVRSHEEEPVQ